MNGGGPTRPHQRQPRERRRLVRPRQPEVGQFHNLRAARPGAHQQVRRLHGPVDEPAVVGVLECLQRPHHPANRSSRESGSPPKRSHLRSPGPGRARDVDIHNDGLPGSPSRPAWRNSSSFRGEVSKPCGHRSCLAIRSSFPLPGNRFGGFCRAGPPSRNQATGPPRAPGTEPSVRVPRPVPPGRPAPSPGIARSAPLCCRRQP